MRLTATIVCTLFLALTALAAEPPGTGDLHVLAPLGTRVFVDGHLAGISLGAKAGLTVQNVAAGPHVVRVTRGNYNPRIMTVTVQPGALVEVNMSDLKIRRRIKVRPREEPVDMTVGSPPMTADDTGTPGGGNWEINTSLEGDFARGEHRYALPRVDVNYGIGEDLQLKYEVPWLLLRETEDDGTSHTAHGLGNSVLGVKYRFYDQEESGLSLAVYPQIEFRSPGSKGVDEGGVAEPTTWLLPLLLVKDFRAASITANAIAEKSTDDSTVNLSAIVGAGMRLSPSAALLGEISGEDLNSSDARRFSIRLGLRKKLDENQVLFGAAGVDLNGGADGLRHRYVTIGYQRFIGQKEKDH